MGIKNYLRAWRDYPIIYFERALDDPENWMVYKMQDFACKLIEGLALGGIAYCLTDEPASFAFGPLISVLCRNMQLRDYIMRKS